MRHLPVAILLASLLWAPASAAQAPGGAELWKRKCAMCHGPDGAAKTRTGARRTLPDLSTPAWQALRTDEQIRGAILRGAPGMPGWAKRLSAEEVDLLVAHVRSLGR